MKILWISHFLLYPDTGFGALQRSRNLLKQLSRESDIHLISLYSPSYIPKGHTINDVQNDLNSICSKVTLFSQSKDKSLKGIFKSLFKLVIQGIPYSIQMYQNPDFYFEIQSAIKKKRFDAIFVDTLGLWEPDIGFKGVTILNHHNIESHMMLRRATLEKKLLLRLLFFIEARLLLRIEKKICQKYTLNVVVSDLDNQRLNILTNGEAQTVIIENGVDCNYFKFMPRKPESKIIMFTGGLNWYPNRDAIESFCKEIFPIVLKQIPNVKLRIVGKRAPSLLDKMILDGMPIELTDFVEDIRPYAADAAVFICPMRNGGGTRLKILDAMSLGIPVISTSMGCEGINAKHTNHIFIADGNEQLTDAIVTLIQSDTLKETLAKNARRLVEENYSYEVLGTKLRQKIKEMVQ